MLIAVVIALVGYGCDPNYFNEHYLPDYDNSGGAISSHDEPPYTITVTFPENKVIRGIVTIENNVESATSSEA